jgi:hypothetical protein
VIVVGSRARGWRGRSLESELAEELKAATRVPIMIAPPGTRRRGKAVAGNGAQR